MDYILHSKYAGTRIAFPVDKFHYNRIAFEEAIIRNPSKPEKEFNHLIKPFPHIKFKNNVFIVKEKPTLESPWRIEDVRETKAYKDGVIWELAPNQVDLKRRELNIASCIIPEDFEEKKEEHLKSIKSLKTIFSGKTEKECNEQLLFLEKIVEKYRIVNVFLPVFSGDVNDFSQLLEASRVQIQLLLKEAYAKKEE